jgi:peroxiredoxin
MHQEEMTSINTMYCSASIFPICGVYTTFLPCSSPGSASTGWQRAQVDAWLMPLQIMPGDRMMREHSRIAVPPLFSGVLIGVVTLVLWLHGVQARTLAEALAEIQVGELQEKPVAPDFQLQDIHGNSVNFADFTGKPMFIYFWATWCTSCKKEMPAFNALYNEFKDQGFVFLTISIQEDPAWVQDVAMKRGYTLPILLDETGEVTKKYGARGTPSIYLVDRGGRVTAQVLGMRAWDSDAGREVFRLLLQ